MAELATGGLIPSGQQSFLLRGECVLPVALMLNSRYRAILEALNMDPPEEAV